MRPVAAAIFTERQDSLGKGGEPVPVRGVRSLFIVGTIFVLDRFLTRAAPMIEIGRCRSSCARSARL